MGYPHNPQDPYGQQPGQSGPQHPYGHSGPQPMQPGYGYRPPTSPPPPKRNIGLILVLAIGLPLLLLGGCAAVVLVLADAGSRTARETLVTEADQPNAVMPSNDPATSAPLAAESSAPVAQEPATAPVGTAITLQGMDPGLKVKVTVTKLVNPATPAQDFTKPKAGNKFVAVEVTLENVGEAVYSDAPMNGGILVDGEGQQYRSTLYDVREGQSFGGMATVNKGDSRKGVIVFEVPEGAKLAKFQFGLNSGFAQQKGEWTLS